ncbi:hypothetical protein EAF00_004541 [Botryotinia globosa]|nr:hypothetical protein EAF00_004541 [Botryotinia globosa]
MYIKDLSSLRWDINIQACRTLDGNTPFFDYVVSGDILNVQKMLRERAGFVDDRFYCSSTSFYWHNFTQEWVGATTLHIAAYNGHHNLCKLLLSANADVSAGDYCSGNQKEKKRFSKATTFSILEHELEGLLQELIGAQIPLHETDHGELTLLQRIVSACMFQRGTNDRGSQILDWIKILQASGIDLEQYDRKERSIFKMKKRNNFESLVILSLWYF